MAAHRPFDVIENPLSGQRVTMILPPAATAGRRFELEVEMAPGRNAEGIPAHVHPTLHERFTILRGVGRYQLGGSQHEAPTGAVVEMPPGVAHLHPWNVGDEPLVYRQTALAEPPDLASAEAALGGLATLFALAAQGKTNRAGMAHPLQMAVIANAMMPGTYLAAAPIRLQHVLLPVLAAIGHAFGYRTRYS
jgi:quercetin dioxygenase-like cupin family protein